MNTCLIFGYRTDLRSSGSSAVGKYFISDVGCYLRCPQLAAFLAGLGEASRFVDSQGYIVEMEDASQKKVKRRFF